MGTILRNKAQLKTIIVSFLGLSCILLFSVGCGKGMKSVPNNPSQGPILQGTSSGNPGSGLVSFKVVFDTVLKDNCVSCHNRDHAAANVQYDTYESTMQHGMLSKVDTDYLHYKEPSSDCKKISKANMDLVRLWIENGAIN